MITIETSYSNVSASTNGPIMALIGLGSAVALFLIGQIYMIVTNVTQAELGEFMDNNCFYTKPWLQNLKTILGTRKREWLFPICEGITVEQVIDYQATKPISGLIYSKFGDFQINQEHSQGQLS